MKLDAFTRKRTIHLVLACEHLAELALGIAMSLESKLYTQMRSNVPRSPHGPKSLKILVLQAFVWVDLRESG